MSPRRFRPRLTDRLDSVGGAAHGDGFLRLMVDEVERVVEFFFVL